MTIWTVSVNIVLEGEIMAINLNSRDKKALEEAVLKAASNLIDYRRIMLVNGPDDLPSPAFHYEWSNILLNGLDSFAVQAFRECGKSTIVLRSFPLYCLTFPDDRLDYIGIIKANADLASAKLKEISREYHSNEAISANRIETIEDSAKALMVRVMDSQGKPRQVRIEAYGKSSAIRGMLYGDKRPRIIIIDDMQDPEDARSPKVMEDQWDSFLSDIKFLGKSTRIFMIGNNLGERCIIERVLKHPELLGFQTRRIPAWIEQNGERKPTWEDKFSLDFLEKELGQYRELGKVGIWMRERLCVSVAPEAALAIPTDIAYYVNAEMMSIASRCNIFVRMDPAFRTGESHDFTSIFVFGIDERGHWYVFDIVYGKWGLEEKIAKLFEVVRRWNPINVGIEGVAGQVMLLEQVRKEMSERTTFFRLIELKTGGRSKAERISLLQPLFKSNRFHLPESAPWLDEFRNELFMTDGEGNCKATHDDLIDSAAYGLYEVMKPFRQKSVQGQNRELQRYSSTRMTL